MKRDGPSSCDCIRRGGRCPKTELPRSPSEQRGVSASFIKELMRRIVQFHIEADGTGNVTHTDIDNALDEMLFLVRSDRDCI
jgi:hypothetical protein